MERKKSHYAAPCQIMGDAVDLHAGTASAYHQHPDAVTVVPHGSARNQQLRREHARFRNIKSGLTIVIHNATKDNPFRSTDPAAFSDSSILRLGKRTGRGNTFRAYWQDSHPKPLRANSRIGSGIAFRFYITYR